MSHFSGLLIMSGFSFQSFPVFHFYPFKLIRTFGDEFFHPTHNTAFQTNLDAMGMSGGLCQKVLNHSFRQSSGSLILLLNKLHIRSRFDFGPVYFVHLFTLFSMTNYHKERTGA